MTPTEIKALREKHQPQPHTEWFPVCATCLTQSPCDVIKVLDATENLKFDDLKTKVECDLCDVEDVAR